MVLLLALMSTGRAADKRVGVQSKAEQEYMFVMGDGQKAWYSALELEHIARTYANTQKLDFKFDSTEKSVWVHTDGGKVLAEVWFKSGGGGRRCRFILAARATF